MVPATLRNSHFPMTSTDLHDAPMAQAPLIGCIGTSFLHKSPRFYKLHTRKPHMDESCQSGQHNVYQNLSTNLFSASTAAFVTLLHVHMISTLISSFFFNVSGVPVCGAAPASATGMNWPLPVISYATLRSSVISFQRHNCGLTCLYFPPA